ncbi:MAG: HAD hydrolase-like protein [Bacteroidaceae bacterium]|nr:HAD hydrolase-like protein [Bacteroidaceae bacterium]
MINYDLKRIKLICFDVDGVLSGSTIPLGEDGIPRRTVNIKDGYAIRLSGLMGVPVAIISGANDSRLITRFSLLGVEDIVLGASVKMKVYESLLEKYGLTDEEVLYMGDDIPDYEVMQRVGCPCCPRDAAPEIRDISCYVSHTDGGMGCGRDIIEQVLKAKGLWMADKKAFGW